MLGSDTVIELDHDMLGKPADLAEARAMLRRLAGRDHHVHTAVSLVCFARGVDVVALSTAVVRMKLFDERLHEDYLATGESLGKAGAYSIQGKGGELIDSVDGDFTKGSRRGAFLLCTMPAHEEPLPRPALSLLVGRLHCLR